MNENQLMYLEQISYYERRVKSTASYKICTYLIALAVFAYFSYQYLPTTGSIIAGFFAFVISFYILLLGYGLLAMKTRIVNQLEDARFNIYIFSHAAVELLLSFTNMVPDLRATMAFAINSLMWRFVLDVALCCLTIPFVAKLFS